MEYPVDPDDPIKLLSFYFNGNNTISRELLRANEDGSEEENDIILYLLNEGSVLPNLQELIKKFVVSLYHQEGGIDTLIQVQNALRKECFKLDVDPIELKEKRVYSDIIQYKLPLSHYTKSTQQKIQETVQESVENLRQDISPFTSSEISSEKSLKFTATDFTIQRSLLIDRFFNEKKEHDWKNEDEKYSVFAMEYQTIKTKNDRIIFLKWVYENLVDEIKMQITEFNTQYETISRLLYQYVKSLYLIMELMYLVFQKKQIGPEQQEKTRQNFNLKYILQFYSKSGLDESYECIGKLFSYVFYSLILFLQYFIFHSISHVIPILLNKSEFQSKFKDDYNLLKKFQHLTEFICKKINIISKEVNLPIFPPLPIESSDILNFKISIHEINENTADIIQRLSLYFNSSVDFSLDRVIELLSQSLNLQNLHLNDYDLIDYYSSANPYLEYFPNEADEIEKFWENYHSLRSMNKSESVQDYLSKAKDIENFLTSYELIFTQTIVIDNMKNIFVDNEKAKSYVSSLFDQCLKNILRLLIPLYKYLVNPNAQNRLNFNHDLENQYSRLSSYLCHQSQLYSPFIRVVIREYTQIYLSLPEYIEQNSDQFLYLEDIIEEFIERQSQRSQRSQRSERSERSSKGSQKSGSQKSKGSQQSKESYALIETTNKDKDKVIDLIDLREEEEKKQERDQNIITQMNDYYKQNAFNVKPEFQTTFGDVPNQPVSEINDALKDRDKGDLAQINEEGSLFYFRLNEILKAHKDEFLYSIQVPFYNEFMDPNIKLEFFNEIFDFLNRTKSKLVQLQNDIDLLWNKKYMYLKRNNAQNTFQSFHTLANHIIYFQHYIQQLGSNFKQIETLRTIQGALVNDITIVQQYSGYFWHDIYYNEIKRNSYENYQNQILQLDEPIINYFMLKSEIETDFNRYLNVLKHSNDEKEILNKIVKIYENVILHLHKEYYLDNLKGSILTLIDLLNKHIESEEDFKKELNEIKREYENQQNPNIQLSDIFTNEDIKDTNYQQYLIKSISNEKEKIKKNKLSENAIAQVFSCDKKADHRLIIDEEKTSKLIFNHKTFQYVYCNAVTKVKEYICQSIKIENKKIETLNIFWVSVNETVQYIKENIEKGITPEFTQLLKNRIMSYNTQQNLSFKYLLSFLLVSNKELNLAKDYEKQEVYKHYLKAKEEQVIFQFFLEVKKYMIKAFNMRKVSLFERNIQSLQELGDQARNEFLKEKKKEVMIQNIAKIITQSYRDIYPECYHNADRKSNTELEKCMKEINEILFLSNGNHIYDGNNLFDYSKQIYLFRKYLTTLKNITNEFIKLTQGKEALHDVNNVYTNPIFLQKVKLLLVIVFFTHINHRAYFNVTDLEKFDSVQKYLEFNIDSNPTLFFFMKSLEDIILNNDLLKTTKFEAITDKSYDFKTLMEKQGNIRFYNIMISFAKELEKNIDYILKKPHENASARRIYKHFLWNKLIYNVFPEISKEIFDRNTLGDPFSPEISVYDDVLSGSIIGKKVNGYLGHIKNEMVVYNQLFLSIKERSFLGDPAKKRNTNSLLLEAYLILLFNIQELETTLNIHLQLDHVVSLLKNVKKTDYKSTINEIVKGINYAIEKRLTYLFFIELLKAIFGIDTLSPYYVNKDQIENIRKKYNSSEERDSELNSIFFTILGDTAFTKFAVKTRLYYEDSLGYEFRYKRNKILQYFHFQEEKPNLSSAEETQLLDVNISYGQEGQEEELINVFLLNELDNPQEYELYKNKNEIKEIEYIKKKAVKGLNELSSDLIIKRIPINWIFREETFDDILLSVIDRCKHSGIAVLGMLPFPTGKTRLYYRHNPTRNPKYTIIARIFQRGTGKDKKYSLTKSIYHIPFQQLNAALRKYTLPSTIYLNRIGYNESILTGTEATNEMQKVLLQEKERISRYKYHLPKYRYIAPFGFGRLWKNKAQNIYRKSLHNINASIQKIVQEESQQRKVSILLYSYPFYVEEYSLPKEYILQVAGSEGNFNYDFFLLLFMDGYFSLLTLKKTDFSSTSEMKSQIRVKLNNFKAILQSKIQTSEKSLSVRDIFNIYNYFSVPFQARMKIQNVDFSSFLCGFFIPRPVSFNLNDNKILPAYTSSRRKKYQYSLALYHTPGSFGEVNQLDDTKFVLRTNNLETNLRSCYTREFITNFTEKYKQLSPHEESLLKLKNKSNFGKNIISRTINKNSKNLKMQQPHKRSILSQQEFSSPYFPIDRTGYQLYPLGQNAYFEGAHKGVSSNFPQCMSDIIFGKMPKEGIASCFGSPPPKKAKKTKRSVKANEWSNEVYNMYTGGYQPGFAKVKYNPYAGVTGMSGFPALSTLTVTQGLLPQ